MQELADEYQGQIEVFKVNIEDNEIFKFDIMSIPTVVLFQNGKEVSRLIGVNSKSEYKNLIDSVLDN